MNLKKNYVPNAFTVNCIIHRQHLVATHLSACLDTSLKYLIKIYVHNKKSKSLTEILFTQLCIEEDKEFNRLQFHTEAYLSNQMKSV